MNCRWLITLLAAMLTTPAPICIAADDAAEILIDKAIAAHGGAESLRKYPAALCKVRGELAIPPGKVPFTGTLIYEIPERYRITLSMEFEGRQVTLVQTVLGGEVKTSVNGQPQPLSDEQKKQVRAAILLQEIGQLVTLRDRKRFTLKLASPQESSDITDRVQVAVPGLEAVTLTFDPKTARLQSTSRKALSPEGKPVTEEIILRECLEVQGVQMPKMIEIRHDGKLFMTMEMTGIQLAEKLDPALFTDPK